MKAAYPLERKMMIEEKELSSLPKQDTKKEDQYGILYPDGTIGWEYNNENKLSTSLGQKSAQENYDRMAERIHMNKQKLFFVKRIRTTKYSSPITFVADRSHE